jgi:hypothetical protein
MHYSNPRMNATIDNWPSGGKRVIATFTIECHPTRGERAVRTTVGAPKKLTYATQMRIVNGDDGRTYIAALRDGHGFITIYRGDMKFAEESAVFAADERYPVLRALFQTQEQAAAE